MNIHSANSVPMGAKSAGATTGPSTSSSTAPNLASSIDAATNPNVVSSSTGTSTGASTGPTVAKATNAPTSSSSSTGPNVAKSNFKPGRPATTFHNLKVLIKDPRFYWFLGHVNILFGSFSYMLYSLGLFLQPSTAKFWYRESYVCVILTFGFVLYGELTSGRLNTSNPAALLFKDTSIQYLYCAMLWLFTPRFVGTLPPFTIFSISHVLNFISTDLLPCFGYSHITSAGAAGAAVGPSSSSTAAATTSLNQKIQNLVNSNSPKFMLAAANIEFLVLVRLIFVSLFTLRVSAMVQLVLYIFFFNLRYHNSAYTHRIVQSWEIRADNLMSHRSLPPVVKKVWIQVKGGIRTMFAYIPGSPRTVSKTNMPSVAATTTTTATSANNKGVNGFNGASTHDIKKEL